jgi:hypothetical protein
MFVGIGIGINRQRFVSSGTPVNTFSNTQWQLIVTQWQDITEGWT